MKVKTNVKAGTLAGDTADLLDDLGARLQVAWDALRPLLTWPW